MSRQLPNNTQGELQGAINAANSLTAIIGPVAATQLFSFFTSPQAPTYFPGVPFFAAGILTVCAATVFVYASWRFGLRRSPDTVQDRYAPDMAKPGEIATPPHDRHRPRRKRN